MRIKPGSKRVFLIILIVVTLGILACGRGQQTTSPPIGQTPIQDVQSTQSGQSNIILFRDDFQQGLSTYWSITSAWDVQQSGDLYVFRSDGFGGAYVPGGYEWSQYVYRANFMVEAGSLVFSFNLTQEGRYLVLVNANGLQLYKESPRDEFTLLAETGPIPDTGWQYIAMGSDQGRVLVYVNGEPWIDYTDSAPLASGTIAVGSLDGSSVIVDNIVVNQLTQSMPYIPVVSPPPLAGAVMPSPADAGQSIDLGDVEPGEPPPPPQDLGDAGDGGDDDGGDDDGDVWLPAEITFLAGDQNTATIEEGECVGLNWTVENALEVYFDDQLVDSSDGFDACPEETTTYTLTALGTDMAYQTAQVTVTVNPADGGGGAVGQPDLRVLNVDIQPKPTPEDVQVQVTVTIYNPEAVDAVGMFTVRWHPEDSASFVGCSWDVNGLAGYAELALNCTYQGYPEPGTFTWFAVVDAEGEIAESDETNNSREGVITIEQAVAIEPPRAPVNCQAGDTTATTVMVRWGIHNDSGQDGFRVYQAGVSLEAEVGPDVFHVTIENLDPNTSYEFEVRTYNSAGESEPGACVFNVTTPAE